MSVTGFNRVRRYKEQMEKENLLKQKKVLSTPAVTEVTNRELMSKLDELGVEYPKKANKSDLLALLEGAKND